MRLRLMSSTCWAESEYRWTRSSNVPFGSSIMACSSPGHGPSIRVGRLVRSSRPRELASRLAGSMVTTQAVRPRRAASRANAAAVVVLPTPPEPQHTMIDLSVTTCSIEVGPDGAAPLAVGPLMTAPCSGR